MNPAATAGYPDDLFLFRGRIAFIEFKRLGGRPRLLQLARIAELREQGFPVEVIDDVDNGIAFLGATLLPSTSGADGCVASVRGVSAAARHGQDHGVLCHPKNSDLAKDD